MKILLSTNYYILHFFFFFIAPLGTPEKFTLELTLLTSSADRKTRAVTDAKFYRVSDDIVKGCRRILASNILTSTMHYD